MVYSGWKVNSSTCTEIELNIYCHCVANVCVCKCSVPDHLVWLILFFQFFFAASSTIILYSFFWYLLWIKFFYSLLNITWIKSRAHTHTHKRARAHTLSRIETFHMSFAEKDPLFDGSNMWWDVFFSLLPCWATGRKKSTHSSKPNEKLGKIAFRLPVVIFVTLRASHNVYGCVIPKLDRFCNKYEPQPMRTKLKRQNIQQYITTSNSIRVAVAAIEIATTSTISDNRTL